MGALIAALLPLASPLIKGLIKGVEKIFGAKTGETKLATVLAAVKPILMQLAAAGKIPGIPDDTTIATLVEMLVQDLKRTEGLDAMPPTPTTTLKPTDNWTIAIPVGARVTIERLS